MDAQMKIYLAFSFGLEKIRTIAQNNSFSFIVALSDFFLNLPYNLEKDNLGEIRMADIILNLGSLAKTKGLHNWFEAVNQDYFERKKINKENDLNHIIYLHFLLYSAFIDIRYEAYKSGNKEIYNIAHILHSIPLRLIKYRKNKKPIEEILNNLKDKANSLQNSEWLIRALES
ncbi:MAG: hypothetical protein HXX08_22735 [Chloroflexi bacterium]|uniref:Uncharacterized protein n=1 Tax=Candidatus Chlorohelix allophototropha TaxID=3003348 RepID=A0A8T7M945_9CHLR|nr:hypothetical protein [Chloroflexota bacterium]WJW68618.1 hypothetical protein OZ401_004232 [Chloroflexota bacterium L227-S17]